ncbi:glycosyltransferase family 1 protein [Peniophora sp. CONT]|nr:glycosyltransferase family 1 protein [Peniophora sp. CONT]
MPKRWPTISRASRQPSPVSGEQDSGEVTANSSTSPEPKIKRRGLRNLSRHCSRDSSIGPTTPTIASEPLNPTEQLLRSLGLNDPGLSRIFADAAQYDQVVRGERDDDGQDVPSGSEPDPDPNDNSVQTKLNGFSRLVGKDLPQSERQASVRIAQLTVNNFTPSPLSEGEGDLFDEDEEGGSEGDGSRTSETALSDGSTAVEDHQVRELEAGHDEAGHGGGLEPEEIVDLLEQEFGALAGPGEEKLIVETDGALVQDVTVLGVLHLTTHRLTFHASLTAASENAPKILKEGAVTVHKGSHRKRRVWMELSHDLLAVYPSSKDEDRIRPIRSILLSAITQVHPHDSVHPRRVRLSCETARGVHNASLEYDTDESARDWRREFHSALFLYRRARRLALNPSGDDTDGVRFNIPLSRLEGVDHNRYLSLATLLCLRISTATSPPPSSASSFTDGPSIETPSTLEAQFAEDAVSEPDVYHVKVGLLKVRPELENLMEYVYAARAYELEHSTYTPRVYFDYGMYDGLGISPTSALNTSYTQANREAEYVVGFGPQPFNALSILLGLDLARQQPWVVKAHLARRFSRVYGTFVVADNLVGFFSRTAIGRDIIYRVPLTILRDVHVAAPIIPLKRVDIALTLVVRGQADLRFLFRTPALRDEALMRIQQALEHARAHGEITTSPRSMSPLPSPGLTHADSPEGKDYLSTSAPSPGEHGTESANPDVERPALRHKSVRSTTSILAPMSRLPKYGSIPVPYPLKSYFPKPINIRPGIPNVRRMHFVCLTIGSRGDVQPYIALGKGLQAHGHTVTIVTHEEYKRWVEGFGIHHRTAGGDPGALMKLSVENKMFSPNFFKESLGNFRSWLDDLLVDAWEQCKDADVLLESPSAMAGVHIAEALKVPYFRTFTMPWTKTRQFPHAFLSPPVESPTFNSASYVLFDNVFWAATSGQINRWRRATLGIGPTDMGHLAQSKIPFIYNFSPAVVPKPLDWGDATTVSGYWFLDNPDLDWTPPEGLQTFMDKARKDGRPLAYIGFGSIVVPDPVALSRNIIAAVVKADVRAIVSRGWSARMTKPGAETEEVEYPEQCYVLDKVPHDWLFPQCDVAVHHGGAGTTGASLRAGVPTLIRPWFGDQFFWASRVQKLGAGLKINSARAAELADALTRATSDRVMKEKAASVGERIRAEDGVNTAIEAIYMYLPRAGVQNRAELT